VPLTPDQNSSQSCFGVDPLHLF